MGCMVSANVRLHSCQSWRLCVVLKWAWRDVEVPPRILLLFNGEQLELPCKSLPVLICPSVKPPILHMVGWISQIYPNAQLVEWKYCHLLHHISLSKFGQVSCRMKLSSLGTQKGIWHWWWSTSLFFREAKGSSICEDNIHLMVWLEE